MVTKQVSKKKIVTKAKKVEKTKTKAKVIKKTKPITKVKTAAKKTKSTTKSTTKSVAKTKSVTKAKSLKIFVIAGEASGDVLGGKLISSIKKLAKDTKLKFIGVGGEHMEREGVKSIFPMEELSVMGVAEILPHIPKLLHRIKQTANAIYKAKPDVVITIDSPDFNFRVMKILVFFQLLVYESALHYTALFWPFWFF